jgi:hypothetical protein
MEAETMASLEQDIKTWLMNDLSVRFLIPCIDRDVQSAVWEYLNRTHPELLPAIRLDGSRFPSVSVSRPIH